MARTRKKQTGPNVCKVQKRGHDEAREWKQGLIDKVQRNVDDKRYVYLVNIHQSNNALIKTVRDTLKQKEAVLMRLNLNVARVALGNTKELEVAPGISKIIPLMKGSVGLIFSDDNSESLSKYLSRFDVPTIAGAGDIATEDVCIRLGGEDLQGYPSSMETQFRGLGVPTKLDEGKILCITNYVVCRKGKTLDAKQAQLLKILGYQMGKFSVSPVAVFDKKKARVNTLVK